MGILERRWQDNTIAATTKYYEGIAKVAGVPANELETVPNGICERYKEGNKGKASSRWREHYLRAILAGTTQEVQKE